MQQEHIRINRPMVSVDNYKRITDLLTNPTVKLFLPVDSLGKIVPVYNACRLECWVTKPDEKRVHLPDVFEYSVNGLSNALISADVDGNGVYATLPYCAAIYSLGRLNDWFHTLYRHPEGDVSDYVMKVKGN